MLFYHRVLVETLKKKIRYKPITLTQYDSTDVIELIFDSNVVNSEVVIQALLPTGEQFKYGLSNIEKIDVVVGNDDSDPSTLSHITRDMDDDYLLDVEILEVSRCEWKIPSEILEVIGYAVLEVKIIDSDGVSTFGRFGVTVKDDLFSNITPVPPTNNIPPKELPFVDECVVDTVECS